MKIYSGRGDEGETNLADGRRVSKDTARIEAGGCVDELASVIGLALCACDVEPLRAMLVDAQRHLLDLGADLAAPQASARIGVQHARDVEACIDAMEATLPALKSFVLPGGCELAARLHVARTVCRRAERRCVALAEAEHVEAAAIAYLNRLSDLLFVMARRANQLSQTGETTWPGEG